MPSGRATTSGISTGPTRRAKSTPSRNSAAGEEVELSTHGEDAKVLLLSGVPIDEPIAAQGPFVMNSRAEILEKVRAFNRGELGSLG